MAKAGLQYKLGLYYNTGSGQIKDWQYLLQ